MNIFLNIMNISFSGSNKRMFPDVIFYCRTIGSGVVKIRKILNRYEQFFIIIKKTIVAYV